MNLRPSGYEPDELTVLLHPATALSQLLVVLSSGIIVLCLINYALYLLAMDKDDIDSMLKMVTEKERDREGFSYEELLDALDLMNSQMDFLQKKLTEIEPEIVRVRDANEKDGILNWKEGCGKELTDEEKRRVDYLIKLVDANEKAKAMTKKIEEKIYAMLILWT